MAKILPGKLLAQALDALETGDASVLAGRSWAGALKGNAGPTPPGLPKAGRIGSSNFGVVANVCELAQGWISPNAEPPRIERAATWLKRFYLRQGPDGDLGHCLLEPLSTTYGEAHIASALIAYALGIKEAGVFLERELALCLLHRCPNGRIVSASTRAGKIREPERPGASGPQWAREEFVKRALGLWPLRGNSLIGRAFDMEGGWRAPLSNRTRPDNRYEARLKDVRLASGPLIWTLHENGHVSRFETGPICYASPVPAAVVCYDPWRVEYVAFPGKTAAPFGELQTEVVAGEGAWPAEVRVSRELGLLLHTLDISALGPVVAEHRFPAVGEGA